jgi:type IV pilus assembly protein PilC
MRRFTYKARDSKTGKMTKGVIQAEDERSAGKLLIEQGLTPSSVSEEREKGLLDRIRNKVRTKDKIVFTRQFATLIGAGLPLSTSLRTVADQTENDAMKRVIEDVLANVEGGRTLTESFSKFPDIFDHVYLALIKAGETSGSLDLSLKRLADQQEKDAEMISKIRGALIYPGIVLVVIIAVMIFMLLVVVPQVQGLYTDLKKDLPWMTAVMVALANFLLNSWWVILIMLVAAVYFFMQFRKTDTGIRWAAIFKLNVPIFKGMFRRLYMARFARTAQNLLSSGVSMLESLSISADAMNNIVVKEEIDAAAEKVKQGKPLSDSLRTRDYMLPLVPQMASIGEQSGRIDEMLGKAAKVYEDELDEQIRTISTMIEPVLMVIMAVLVGGMVGAILFPIYALVNEIQMG